MLGELPPEPVSSVARQRSPAVPRRRPLRSRYFARRQALAPRAGLRLSPRPKKSRRLGTASNSSARGRQCDAALRAEARSMHPAASGAGPVELNGFSDTAFGEALLRPGLRYRRQGLHSSARHGGHRKSRDPLGHQPALALLRLRSAAHHGSPDARPSETPLPLPAAVLRTTAEAVDRVFWYALGRAPLPDERAAAEAALRQSRPSIGRRAGRPAVGRS